MKSISPNLNIMIKACEKSAKVLVRDFGEIENLQVSRKGPRDFVTNADMKVEKILINELSKKKFSIISEECGTKIKGDKNNFWIIDPIDGTTNFLHGIPHFAISIALKSKNEIISGIIFDPIKNEMFYAEKNSGSFFNNQRIRVSKKNSLEECLFATNHVGTKFTDLNVRYTGCAALDLAYVAAGRFDGYFHNNINIWDIAAGVLLIEEAGGKVNDINSFKLNSIDVRASSNEIHEKMNEKLLNF